eukprot:CAMPEP_0114457490 /NCGR_PEP_ID=MMETSP0104-20121206/4189_1 /TAXON_ID=37642 ORGANISM="Paraphysomonas imperforata, Strain PA2" /NCGR_SAMPLE_ID=MMETSP0104 /ASSEMBLY_ACC=CAM_ASM_000202 /LENGTH=32 /DNA_ID= /DNA_START= /DNA_END= /DNA_ORIENTATION=
MVKIYVDNLNCEDDDVEIYGSERTRIRHEGNL